MPKNSVGPKVEFKQKEMTGILHNNCELQAIVNGIPFPDVKWVKDDKPIEESQNIKCVIEENVCTLRITDASLEMSGTYKCVATNSVGKAEAKGALKINGNVCVYVCMCVCEFGL